MCISKPAEHKQHHTDTLAVLLLVLCVLGSCCGSVTCTHACLCCHRHACLCCQRHEGLCCCEGVLDSCYSVGLHQLLTSKCEQMFLSYTQPCFCHTRNHTARWSPTAKYRKPRARSRLLWLLLREIRRDVLRGLQPECLPGSMGQRGCCWPVSCCCKLLFWSIMPRPRHCQGSLKLCNIATFTSTVCGSVNGDAGAEASRGVTLIVLRVCGSDLLPML